MTDVDDARRHDPPRTGLGVTLPGPVRDRALALAADTLGALPAGEVPARLKAVARFAPARRAKLGAALLATALDADPAFLARVAEVARARSPELAAELDAGPRLCCGRPHRGRGARLPPARPSVARARRRRGNRPRDRRPIGSGGRAGGRTTARPARGGSERKARPRSTTSGSRPRWPGPTPRACAGRSRTPVETSRPPSRARGTPRTSAAAAAAEADRRVTVAESEARRLRDRSAELEQALEAARRATRQGRSAEDVRLRLLLDTLVDAATGLRRELALPPVAAGARPGDAVAEELGDQAAGSGTSSARSRALLPDDPAVLDQLLALPQVHLVVDGYNVTKTGYGTLPLDAQRARLLTGLAGLAARTGAEVTCVFDGAALDQPTPVAQPRGVRVIFSPPGITADSVIRRLVRDEPLGRAVVVVSSDREVADGVAAAGARPVASAALVRRLDRS